ncbi:MAG: hypothetical protein MUD10_00150 [Candidatus Pacebacteria bacterium]|nr:hypothetical protein [Candidatus Paceibacterota bacterium]
MKIFKTKSYSNQGTSPIKGVRIVDLSRIFGVIQATNEVFLPSIGPKIRYNGLTGAELMAASILRDLAGSELSCKNIDPVAILTTVNRKLRSLLPNKEMITHTPAFLPYARFALLFISDNGKAEVIAGGDCQAIAQTTEGKLLWTENQAGPYDLENYRIIGLHMDAQTKKYASENKMAIDDLKRENIEKIREAMWKRFAPELVDRRNRAINSTFAALNGNLRITQRWQRLPLGNLTDIERIICYTGGFVNIAATQNMRTLAHKIISDYDMHGLRSTVQTAQNMFSLNCRMAHITKREVGVMVIEP